jgi:hypothetical protein
MNKFKKFIWGGIAAVAIGGFAIFNVSLNSQNGLSSSSVFLQNLEALSDGENGGSQTYRWTQNEIKCDQGSGKYKSCNANGTGNICSPGGSTTCTCGLNCN